MFIIKQIYKAQEYKWNVEDILYCNYVPVFKGISSNTKSKTTKTSYNSKTFTKH